MDEKLRLVLELQNKASAELKKFGKDLEGVKPGAGAKATASWFQTLESASGDATKALRPMTGALNTMGVSSLAAGLSVTGLIAQFRDLARTVPALQELSRQTGMTKTEIERLKYAAKDLNIDPSKMTASLDYFSGQMVQFHRRTGTLYAEMQNGASGLADKIRTEEPGDAYRDMLKWLAAIPEAQMKAGKSAADAAQIQKYWIGQALGDEGLSPLLGKGMAGFDHAMDNAKKNVGEITDDLISQANKLNESINAFDQSWHNFETTVGPTVFKNLTAATEDFRQVFKTVEDAAAWYEKAKDHPVQAVAEAAENAVDAQAQHNREHPEGIILDVPGIASKVMHYFTDKASAKPATPPDSRPLTLRQSVPVPTAFRVPDAYNREMRARRPNDLDGFVVGELGKEVIHLTGTLRSASGTIADNIHPAAFHGGSTGLTGVDAAATIAGAVKEGTLSAFREWVGMQDLDKGGGGGGVTLAAYHPGGGMPGGRSAAAAGDMPRAPQGHRGGAGTDPSLGRFEGDAPGANGYGLINAPYRGALDAKGEGGHLSPRELFNHLKAQGASDNEALMLTGAAGSEASFNPNAVHDIHSKNGPGHGLWGHNDKRLNMNGRSWQDQADLALRELRSRPEHGAVDAAKTPEELALAEMRYEAPRGYTKANPRGGDNYTGRLNTLRRFSHGFGTMGFDPAKPMPEPAPGAGGFSHAAAGRIGGLLTMDGESFRYGSGGRNGAAHVPFGDYPITPSAIGAWGASHGAIGLNGNAMWDKSLGRMRTGIEMHAEKTAELVTSGCLGFMESQYPRLKSKVHDMIAKTGNAYLHVGPNGASITPDRAAPQARPEIAPLPAIAPEPAKQPAMEHRVSLDPLHVNLTHTESGRTRVAVRHGEGIKVSLRTAPTMVQTG